MEVAKRKRGRPAGMTRQSYASSLPPEVQCKTTLSISLGTELAPRVAEYHRSLQNIGIVGSSVQESVRELIAVGLNTNVDPSEQASYDRLQTIRSVRRWAFARLNNFFHELEQELRVTGQLPPEGEQE